MCYTGMIDFLISSHPIAKVLRDHIVFKIVPMLCPDGVYLGNYRCVMVSCSAVHFPLMSHSKQYHAVIKIYAENPESDKPFVDSPHCAPNPIWVVGSRLGFYSKGTVDIYQTYAGELSSQPLECFIWAEWFVLVIASPCYWIPYAMMMMFLCMMLVHVAV